MPTTILSGGKRNDKDSDQQPRRYPGDNRYASDIQGINKTDSSISIEQETVPFQKEKTKISIKGRHDPCIVPRAIPCVESAASLAIYDSLLGSRIHRKGENNR